MYFEDGFSDGMRRNFVGTLYFVIALFGTCLNLATLTVLPECERTLKRPLFIFFSVQLFINIAALFCVGVPVPYMIAVNKSFFLNPILESAPGVLLNLCLIMSFAVQFWICVYRNINVVFSRYSNRLFPDTVVHCLNLLAFVLALNRVIEMSRFTTARRFHVSSLSWSQSQEEWLSLLSLVVYAAMAGLMFYALAIFDLMYQHLYLLPKLDACPSPPFRKLLFQLLHLLCDIVFCLLLVLPRGSSVGDVAVIHSIATVYGTILWPTISLILYSHNVRQELCFRVSLMLKASQMNGTESRGRPDSRIRFI